jgi:riboflavin-specific deaminase-like protein
MFVYSNLATSLDGKIATSNRVFFPLGTPLDRKIMRELRGKCDALVIGAASLRTFKRPHHALPGMRHPLNVIVSHELRGLSPRWKFFTDRSIQRLLLVTGEVPAARLRAFEKTSVVARLSPRKPLAPQILRTLARLRFRTAVVEGGGELMWEFVSRNLIDEYWVTLTPRLLGGATAPTLVDGTGLAPARTRALRLVRCKRIGNELYLRYRKLS